MFAYACVVFTFTLILSIIGLLVGTCEDYIVEVVLVYSLGLAICLTYILKIQGIIWKGRMIFMDQNIVPTNQECAEILKVILDNLVLPRGYNKSILQRLLNSLRKRQTMTRN